GGEGGVTAAPRLCPGADAPRAWRVGHPLAPAIPARGAVPPPIDEPQDEVAKEPKPDDRPHGDEQPRLELGAHAEVSLEPVDHVSVVGCGDKVGGGPARRQLAGFKSSSRRPPSRAWHTAWPSCRSGPERD